MNSTTEQPADLILVGDVVTVSDTQPSAEAVAIREGTILAVGTKADVLKFKGDRTVIRDLSGKAILPGFIDAHGHIAQFLLTKPAPMLWPPPAGDVSSIADLVQIMKKYIADYNIPAGELVVAMGYDDAGWLSTGTRQRETWMKSQPGTRSSWYTPPATSGS